MQKFLVGSLAVIFVVRSCFYRRRNSRLYRPLSLFFCPRDVLTIDIPSIVCFYRHFLFFFHPVCSARGAFLLRYR
uniref:Putative secreted protein n=1 Tax=Ixodes ricinus TaxID=34613 RepID=A0A6B0U3M5_IXORI